MTATKDQLQALLERVENTEGHEPDIEDDIALTFETEAQYWDGDGELYVRRSPLIGWTPVPAYTASIDAALALVERVLPGSEIKLHINNPERDWQAACIRTKSLEMLCGECATAPLSIIAALLKALILQPREKTE